MELSDSRPDDDVMTTEASMPPMMFAEAESGAAVLCSAWLCRPVNDLQTIVRNVKIKLEPKRLGI
jgi:hypothetical protein